MYIHPFNRYTCTRSNRSGLYLSKKQSPRNMASSTTVCIPVESVRRLLTFAGTFMLLKKKDDGTWENMTIGHFSDMSQFIQEFENYGTIDATIKVTYRAYGDEAKARTIQIPLVPDTQKLETFHVNMHGSPTDAFNMGQKYSKWFTECFGYDVVFVYIGNENKRPVIFEDMQPLAPDPLTAFFKKNVPFLGRKVERLMGIRQTEQWRIKFQDCAPFLITSKTSLDDVSSRLDGEKMDMVKFRPNIVIEGANEPWQEDYWGKITINQKTEMIMAHNCVRCKSINLDYNTGKPGVGPSGEVLKRLQKDRRIDIGAKWSPVFGRYTFWGPDAPKSQLIKVGDRVNVTKVNEGLTIWSESTYRPKQIPVLTVRRLARSVLIINLAPLCSHYM